MRKLGKASVKSFLGRVDPLLMWSGAPRRRDAGALFDEAYYRRQLGGKAGAKNRGFAHYLRAGERRGLLPHPIFDPVYVRLQLDARGEDAASPYLAFLRSRTPPYLSPNRLFEPETFLDALPPEARNAAMHMGNPVLYFLERWAETRARFSRFFDVGYYERANPEIAGTEANPLVHYMSRPAEKRTDANPMFDAAYYRSVYPAAHADALTEFLLFGHRMRYLPNPYAADELAPFERVTPRDLLAYLEGAAS